MSPEDMETLEEASEHGGACIGMRLALPKSWAQDEERREEAKTPEDIGHETKQELALEMVDDALGWGLEKLPVVFDAGYGDSVAFREALDERELQYVARVTGTAVVWPPGTCPTPPPSKKKGRARGPTRRTSPQPSISPTLQPASKHDAQAPRLPHQDPPGLAGVHARAPQCSSAQAVAAGKRQVVGVSS